MQLQNRLQNCPLLSNKGLSHRKSYKQQKRQKEPFIYCADPEQGRLGRFKVVAKAERIGFDPEPPCQRSSQPLFV